MAVGDGKVFNIALGNLKNYASQVGVGNAAFIMLLLKSTGLEADSALLDYDTISALLAAANDECDFTNYARKTISAATITVDDTNNRVDIDIADQTWTSAGGASNNTIGAVVLAFDNDTTGGNDTNLVPVAKWECATTTDGTNFTASVNAAGALRSSGV